MGFEPRTLQLGNLIPGPCLPTLWIFLKVFVIACFALFAFAGPFARSCGTFMGQGPS